MNGEAPMSVIAFDKEMKYASVVLTNEEFWIMDELRNVRRLAASPLNVHSLCTVSSMLRGCSLHLHYLSLSSLSSLSLLVSLSASFILLCILKQRSGREA